jgi:murein DD-endopeptidase MepM/ murein hydrolase activator NlpD
LQVHHGVEFVNPRGTPILAVEAGTVFYAGDDLGTQFGPYTNYYGNLVVIQHNFSAPDGQPVFSLYGHMDRTEVQTGQQVGRAQQIGVVGASGIAQGAHLHFEIRVGSPFDFGATRNPELWIRPYPRYGTLAGRTLDSSGNRLYQVTIKVESTNITRYAFSYADDAVNPDPQFGEHFTLGDLPADYYEVSVNENGRVRFWQVIYIYPNRTTWLDVQLN